jgi:hypothetical protein
MRPPVYDARISGRSRISDDDRWRERYPSSNGASAKTPSEALSRLLVLAYLTAISIPPVGLALAIVVGLRLSRRHAIWIALLSLATAAVWILILTSGSLDSASSTDF